MADPFTLGATPGESLNRIGLAQIAKSQDAFLYQRAVAEEQRRNAERNAAAFELFQKEQKILASEAETKADNEAKRQLKQIGLSAKELDAAQKAHLEADKEKIQAVLKNLAAQKLATNARIRELAGPPTSQEVVQLMYQDPKVQTIVAKLTPKQKEILDSGNEALVEEELSKWRIGQSKESKALASVYSDAKAYLQQGRAAESQAILTDLKQKHADIHGFLAREYGVGGIVLDEAPAAPTQTKEKKAGLPGSGGAAGGASRNVGVGPLSPGEADLFGFRGQAKQPPGYVEGLIPGAFQSVGNAASGLASNIAGSDVGLAATDAARLLQNKYANARTALLGGVPQPIPQSSGAFGRILSTINPSQSLGAQALSSMAPSKADVFNLLRLIGVSQPPPASPWQSGADAFRYDLRMYSPLAPLTPADVPAIPEAYFQMTR